MKERSAIINGEWIEDELKQAVLNRSAEFGVDYMEQRRAREVT